MATSFTQNATSSGSAGPTDLQLSFEDIYVEISDYLGWSRTPAGQRLATVRRYANDGYRVFLMGADPRTGEAHEWSFLAPAASLDVAAGAEAVSLPGDFQCVVDDFTFGPAGPGGRLRQVSVLEIERLRAGSGGARGVPSLYAVRPAPPLSESGQRYQALLWPVPAQDCSLRWRYRVSVPEMSTATDYPVGGAAHSQTILQAGLMIAEARANDGQTGGVAGYHKALFEQLMAHSISLDRRLAPGSLGACAEGRRGVAWDRRGTVTYG